MKLFLLALCSALCFSSITCAKLPPSFQRCSAKDSNCLSTAIESAIKQLNKPIKSVGLPSLNPLEVPSLTIPAGSNVVGLEQVFKNMKFHGLDQPQKTKFEIDLEKKTAKMQIYLEKIRIESQYDMKGKILLLPVQGKGNSIITLDKVSGSEIFTLEEYDKKGDKHFKVVQGKLTLAAEHVGFHFDNLFDGNKELGENVNNVINDNWKEIFDDVKGHYEQAFGEIISGLFNSLLAKVPISELFLDQ